MNLRAKPGTIIVKPLDRDDTEAEMASGLVIPDNLRDRQRYMQYEIVAVGERINEWALAPGLRVVIRARSGTPFVLDNQEYLTIFEDNLIAIIG